MKLNLKIKAYYLYQISPMISKKTQDRSILCPKSINHKIFPYQSLTG